MGIPFSSERSSKLAQWLENGVQLKQPRKALRVLNENGVTTLTEFMLLCEPERDELVSAMQRAGVVLGDRSKIRRADPHSVGEYMKYVQVDGALSDRSSPAASPSRPNRKLSNVSSLGDAPPPRTTSKPIKGAPAWWKDHDTKIIKLAKAAQKNMGGESPSYEWLEVRGHGWEKYQAALWARRKEMLDERKFTKDPELKTEWLALILEIDRTLDGTGEVVPAREDYAWYSRRTEPNYVNALLERRTEMLRCDLTQTPSLQAEWVLLMRELEFTLSPLGSRGGASLDDSGMSEISASPNKMGPTSEGQSLLLDNIEAWRQDIERVTAGRPMSTCSAMSDRSNLDRAASLASFYSANYSSDHQSDIDEFFSDSEELHADLLERVTPTLQPQTVTA